MNPTLSLILSASLGMVMATCPAMPQVNSCVQTTNQFRIAPCAPTDYQCQCDGYTYMAACFIPCPSDPAVAQMAQRYDGLKQNLCTSASLTSKAPEATSTPPSATPSEITAIVTPKPSNPAKPDTGKPNNDNNPNHSGAMTNYLTISSLVMTTLTLLTQ